MTTVDTIPGATLKKQRTRPESVLRQALRLRRTQIGLAIMVLLMIVAVFGRYVAPFGEVEGVDGGQVNNLHAKGALFGSDYFGSDVWSRFLYGGRPILIQAFFATLLGVGLGSFLGMLAAYRRGMFDEALMRGLDVLLSQETGLPIHVDEDPLTCVVRGTGKILDDEEKYWSVLTT